MGLSSTAMSPVIMFSLVMLVYLIVLLCAALIRAAWKCLRMINIQIFESFGQGHLSDKTAITRGIFRPDGLFIIGDSIDNICMIV